MIKIKVIYDSIPLNKLTSISKAITLWNCDVFDILRRTLNKHAYLTEKVINKILYDCLYIIKHTAKQIQQNNETQNEVLDFIISTSQEIAKNYEIEDLIYLLGTNSEQPEHNYSMVNRLTILLAMAIKNGVKIDF